ncbi:MFS transporter [Paenibacillus hamazuiensis]|uniref:MFS transporter n=1 Tax=Paenibacillus hamazuiensis TaxID=2936508 RepID=UPI0020102893|nr:MFS transporter [Paenibacillus hamazuiensis]
MNKLTSIFFLIMFLIGTDTFLISPLIPTLQSMFQVSTEVSGWMMGAYTLGAALFALVAGPLSDGLNRKKVMLAGMTGFAVSTLLCGFATGFWSMCLFRFLAGVSAAFTAPQVWAAVPSLLPAPKIAKAMGIVYAGLAVSQALGVPIGSMLAAVHWQYPFFAIGICSLLLAAVIFVAVPDMKPSQVPGAKTPIFQRYVPLLTSGRARGTFLAYFFIHLGSNAAFAFLGKWMTDRFHLSVDQIGYMMILLGLGNLAGSMGSGYVSGVLNRFNTMVIGFVLLIAAFVSLPHFTSVSAVAGAYFVIFALLGIMFPLIIGILTSLNPSIRGTISSLSTSTMNAATTLASWIAGMLYVLFNGFSAIGIFAAVCFAGALFIFALSGVLAGETGTTAEKKPA